MAVPGAPLGLSVTPIENGLSWDHDPVVADPVVTHYQYQIGPTDAPWTDYPAPPHVAYPLMPGVQVALRVRAVNADGAGNSTNTQATPGPNNPGNDNGWDEPTFYARNYTRTPNGSTPGFGNLDWFDPDD